MSLFVTSEHGFMVQDNFAVDSLYSHVIALEIPHYYFVKKVTLMTVATEMTEIKDY